MSNDGLAEMLEVSSHEPSWLRHSLANLHFASRAMLMGATALASVAVVDPASAQAPQPQPNILIVTAHG